ncbi:hypothetical protein [Clostridium aceticum]|uniref:hypothetical protein n=1 Tax=Clostridium aceticum TaxID=84022 RepID=UPI0005CDF0B6|nr:hypothetical protein [Clostridium aceticum]KJF25601.1 hypothetical protein TZ02_17760 [Clostridium aceticum]
MFTRKPETKNKSLVLRMTETQKKILEIMANERGLSQSELIMILLENEFKKPVLEIKQQD